MSFAAGVAGLEDGFVPPSSLVVLPLQAPQSRRIAATTKITGSRVGSHDEDRGSPRRATTWPVVPTSIGKFRCGRQNVRTTSQGSTPQVATSSADGRRVARKVVARLARRRRRRPSRRARARRTPRLGRSPRSREGEEVLELRLVRGTGGFMQ